MRDQRAVEQGEMKGQSDSGTRPAHIALPSKRIPRLWLRAEPRQLRTKAHRLTTTLAQQSHILFFFFF